MLAAVAPDDGRGSVQISHYEPGVGSAWGERIRGGAFGWGLSRGVSRAYEWLARNYEPGDEVFFFGFSRGAFMARSTAGLIRNCGILRAPTRDLIKKAYAIYRSDEEPDGPNATAFRTTHSHPLATIRFIGVWDTVGSLGIPWSFNPIITWINRRWRFHDTSLSSYVEHAYQALAVDEVRKQFAPTLWKAPANSPRDQKVEQVWFAGAHSDVGGGLAESGLSDLALLWIAERAEDAGLAFTAESLTPGQDGHGTGMPAPVRPDPMGRMHARPSGLFRFLPKGVRAIGAAERGHEAAARSAVIRTERDPAYRPASLLEALGRQIRQVPLPRRAREG